MSYLSLYRQWRPQTFEDIVGQEHIVRTLRNAISNSRVVHAYMFAGPRGTGKTSTAKVFAKALNCSEGPTIKPCGVCVSCVAVKEGNALDVIEIDAASNRGIDEIRDLRDKVRFSPAQGRYKVYIIDEVHMLTMEAFNALLKTLEEPPSHAIFILATTEANRVPSTILSRCQRFDFNRLNVTQLSAHLKRICDEIGVKYEADALTLIARRAEGSARDSLGLLEQVSAAGEKITTGMIADMLGATNFDRLTDIAEAIANSDTGKLYPLISDTLSSGTDPRQLLGEMGEHFMDLMLASECPDRKDLLHSGEERFPQLSKAAAMFRKGRLHSIIKSIGLGLAEIGKAHNPRLTLELFLARLIQDASAAISPEAAVEVAGPRTGEGQATVPAPTKRQQSATQASEKVHPASEKSEKAEKAGEQAVQPNKQEATEIADVKTSEAQPQGTTQIWNKVLEQLRRRNVRVEAFARQAVPHFDGAALTLEYTSDWFFHHQKMKEEANEALMKEIVKEVAGPSVEYRCLLLKEGEKPSSEASAAKKPAKQAHKQESTVVKPGDEGAASKADDGTKIKDEEKVQKSLDKLKALFSEVEIKIVEE